MCSASLGLALGAEYKVDSALRSRIVAYLSTLRREEGGYGWDTDVVAQATPTFAAVGCFRLLDVPVPDSSKVAAFLRDRYPVPERRRTERPLWRLDFEQVQALLWMNEPVDAFRQRAEKWLRPAAFTKAYELDGNPVFQHQALAIHTRRLLGIKEPEGDSPWRDYVRARRRPDGTFNHTPASDGTPGHLLNTLWGVWASDALGIREPSDKLAAWVRSCQTPSGGFTYAPGATLGAVDDIAYTWAALHLLKLLDSTPANSAGCAAWISSLLTKEGGFQDLPGGEPNPLATFYALDALRLLGRSWKFAAKPAPRAQRYPIPAGARVFSMQIEAPGNGSPSEAVEFAEAVGIHLWTAKNAEPGWVEAANRVVADRKAQVQFHDAGEDYGTYFRVPGLGTYSHLTDWVAPAGQDFGPMMPKKAYAYSHDEVRDARFVPLKRAGGRLIWQFLENEELTRVLLDESAKTRDYAGISTFHFGNENFLHSQTYLHRWVGRIPFVALQDSHSAEAWWWGDMLAGFTTLYIATKPGWQGWLDALEKNHVISVRHDAVTGWKTHWGGGTPEVREFVRKHERQWRWWGDDNQQCRRPVAALTPLTAGARFEEGAPATGSAVRLRLWHDNNGQAVPGAARSELVSFTVDGREVRPEVTTVQKGRYRDRYQLVSVPDPGAHVAIATIRVLATGAVQKIEKRWTS
jgi:hypothetical protein